MCQSSVAHFQYPLSPSTRHQAGAQDMDRDPTPQQSPIPQHHQLHNCCGKDRTVPILQYVIGLVGGRQLSGEEGRSAPGSPSSNTVPCHPFSLVEWYNTTYLSQVQKGGHTRKNDKLWSHVTLWTSGAPNPLCKGKLAQPFLRETWQSLMSYDSAIPLFGVFPKETSSRTFALELFIKCLTK